MSLRLSASGDDIGPEFQEVKRKYALGIKKKKNLANCMHLES